MQDRQDENAGDDGVERFDVNSVGERGEDIGLPGGIVCERQRKGHIGHDVLHVSRLYVRAKISTGMSDRRPAVRERHVAPDSSLGKPTGERAAIIGLVAGGARRIDAEHSLEELAGLADAAARGVVLRVLQERPKPDPATFLGSGKVDLLARAAAEADVDIVVFDNELSPAQLRELQKRLALKVVDRTQLILDIFAAARADPRGQAASRAGAAEIPAAAADRRRARVVAAGRRHRHSRTWRDEARSRSPQDPHAHSHAADRDRRGAAPPIAAARAAAEDRRADGRAGRLHQRRQDHAVQPADPFRRGRLERALRHARSAGATGAPAGSARAAAVRHGRLHRSPAARAGRGVSRHARGNGSGRPGACT